MVRRTLNPEEIKAAERLEIIWKGKREDFGSQMNFALACGWGTQGAFSQYLKGKVRISLEALLIMSKNLGVSPDEIYPELAEKFDVAGAAQQTKTEIEKLLSMATPRSQKALEKINQAVEEGKLTEQQIELLESIADHLMKK